IQKAKLLFNNAQILSLEKEQEYLNKEFDSFELKTNLISSRIEKLRFELREKERIYNFWNNEFNNRKQEEVQKNISNSLNLLKSLTKTSSLFTDELSLLAQENLKLALKAREPDGIENKILSINDKYKNYNQEYKKQKNQLDLLKQKSLTEVSTSGWAFSLRQEKSKLPNPNDINNLLKNFNNELLLIENEYNDLLSRRLKISEIENQLWNTFNQYTQDISEFEKKNIRKSIDDLIKTQKNILSTLISDYENYISMLSQTIETLNLWGQHTYEFKNFIDENIIWIRSPFPRLVLLKSEFNKLYETLLQINLYSYQEFIYKIVFISSIGLLGLIILVLLNNRFEQQIETATIQIKIPLNFSISKLIRFLYLYLIRILLIPLWLFLIGMYLDTFSQGAELVHIIANGLELLFFPILFFQILYTLVRVHSLSEIILKPIKHNLIELRFKFRIAFIWLTINLFIILLSSQLIPEFVLADLVFRISFSLFLLSSAIISFYVSLFLKNKSQSPECKNQIVKFISNFLIIISIICTSLVILNFTGYNYGSLEITKKLFFTLFFITIFFVLYRVSEITLNYYRWKFALNTSIATHTTLSHSIQVKDSSLQESSLQTDNGETLFYHVERFIRYLLFILFFVVTIYIWSDTFPALTYLDKIHLWRASSVTEVINTANTQTTQSNTGQVSAPPMVEEWISLLDLLASVITIIITFVIIRNISFYSDYLLSKYTKIQHGERYAIITLSKYIIFTIGFLISLGLINITWNKVQWLVAGLGIGFGFGLQEIVANFVSGLIVLFERPLRIGDIVTIGDISGKVKSLQMRSTTIVNWDNKELIVPNKDLLTQQLINWTRNEPKIRLCIPIGVSYHSDINKVISILTEIGQSHPFAETDPPPRAYFLRFGSSSLDFELRLFTHSSYYLDIQHELLCTIFNRFKEENIEISYPQLDVHIRSEHRLTDNNNDLNTRELNDTQELAKDEPK
ncbi:MAG: mechanosensitive ion channel domain-containing protein, partial [Candidatus Hydrogenedens sp.]